MRGFLAERRRSGAGARTLGRGLAGIKSFVRYLERKGLAHSGGLAATRAIRAADSGVLDPHVVILAMTAHAMASDRQRCLAAGMNDHLTKPIQSDILAAALANHLGVAPAGAN